MFFVWWDFLGWGFFLPFLIPRLVQHLDCCKGTFNSVSLQPLNSFFKSFKQFLSMNALQWHYLLCIRVAFSCSFHFANPFFCLASPVVQVKLEKLHVDGLLDFALLHPATGFVCMNILVMDALAMKQLEFNIPVSELGLTSMLSIYRLKILMPHCPLLKNNHFTHPSVLETTRICTDRIPQCDCFYCTSCRS